MPSAGEIEARLFDLAPGEGAMEWDNVGLLVGDPERPVERVLVALDITEAVADKDLFEEIKAKVNDQAEKIKSGEIDVVNAQTGEELDPAACPRVIIQTA